MNVYFKAVLMSMLGKFHFSVNYPMYANYGQIGKAIADKIAETIAVMVEKITGDINLNEIYYEKTLWFRQQIENYISNDAKNSVKYLFTNEINI